MKLLSLSLSAIFACPPSYCTLYSVVNSGPSMVTWQCPAPAVVIGSATTDGGRMWDDMMTVAVACRMGGAAHSRGSSQSWLYFQSVEDATGLPYLGDLSNTSYRVPSNIWNPAELWIGTITSSTARSQKETQIARNKWNQWLRWRNACKMTTFLAGAGCCCTSYI